MSHYKTYPEYKNSGIEWLGEVPAHWSVLRVGAIFEETNERGGSKEELLAVSQEHGIMPQSEYSALLDRRLSQSQSEEYSNYKRVDQGDFVYNKMRMWQGAIGYPSCSGCVSPAYVTFRPRKEISQFYWYSLFKTHDFLVEVNRRSQGICDDQNSCSFSGFKGIFVPTPPPEEQLAIQEALQAETSRLDTLITKKRKFIELLNERRQSLITQAVTKGLDPNVPMMDSGFEWLGHIPDHWDIKPLKMLIPKGSSISYGIVQPGEALEEGVPFVQTTNMTQGNFSIDDLQKTSESIASSYPRSTLRGGEVLLGIRASIGAAHIAPDSLAGANLSRGVARIECSDLIYSEFLLFFFKSKCAEEYWWFARQGSTFNEVSIATVKNHPIPIPSTEDQRKIVAHLKSVTQEISLLIGKTQRSIDLLKERRSALITAAVTGKIDLRNENGKEAA